MDLISVIVPIYKVEAYLDKCIESIVCQTYKNLEIILVDDGSPDRCPEMCDEWAEKDNRIKVIHKENGGLSDARNAGFDIATGNYIAFVDSDDYLDKDLYKTLICAVAETESDIALCRYIDYWEDKPVVVPESSYSYEVYDNSEAMAELIAGKAIQQVVWNKLYKRDICSNVTFEKGKCNEDEFWSYRVIGNAEKVVSVDYYGYFYLQRSGSIMGAGYSIKRLDVLEALSLRLEYLSKNYPELKLAGKKSLLFASLYHGQKAIKYLDKRDKTTAIKTVSNILKKYRFEKNELYYLSIKDKFWIGLGRINARLTCVLRNWLGIGL